MSSGGIQDHRASGKPGRWAKGRWSWAFARRGGKWVRNDFLIGKPDDPMMCRWRLLQTPQFGVYLHYIHREDLDPVPHDHPWRFRSLVLCGGYSEIYHGDARTIEPSEVRRHLAGSVHGFPLHAAHRITAVIPGTVTLVLVGRKLRTWGFYDTNRGNAFVDWRDALGIRPTEGSRSTGKYAKTFSPVASTEVKP
jgi:hypothetical protein